MLSTFPDMPAISFGVADAKAVPRATSAAGLEGLQTSQLVFYGSSGAGPPHAPVAGVGDDKLQFEWAWLKGHTQNNNKMDVSPTYGIYPCRGLCLTLDE